MKKTVLQTEHCLFLQLTVRAWLTKSRLWLMPVNILQNFSDKDNLLTDMKKTVLQTEHCLFFFIICESAVENIF